MVSRKYIDKLNDNSDSDLLEMLDAGEFNLGVLDKRDFFVTACGIAPESFCVAYIKKNKDIDVNIESSWGELALLNAVYNDKPNLSRHLLKNGANPNIKNNAGSTPLIISCFLYHKEMAKELIESGADVNLRSYNGETALMEAVKQGDCEMLELLLQNKANINIANFDNISPLYYAVKYKDIKTVSVLLEYNPNPNIGYGIIDPSILDVSQKPEIRQLISEYVDKFDRLEKSATEFKQETVIINKAKNSVKRAKIAKIKNARKI